MLEISHSLDITDVFLSSSYSWGMMVRKGKKGLVRFHVCMYTLSLCNAVLHK